MYRPDGLRQVGLIHPFVTQYSSDRWLTPTASAALPVLTRSFRDGRAGGVLTLRILPSLAVHAGGSTTRWLEEVDLRDCSVRRITACNCWYCSSSSSVEKLVELRDRVRRGPMQAEGDRPSPDELWAGIVAEVATMPDVVANLLREHRP